MDNKILGEIFSKLEANLPEIQSNQAYVEGKNPYILNKPDGKKPDNRIPIALAKMTVENMDGYAGRAGDRTTKYELADTSIENPDDPFIAYTRAMDIYNEEPIETSELYDESLTQGEAYEIWWSSTAVKLPDSRLTAEYRMVPIENVYIQWTDEIKPTIEYFVYFSGDPEARTASVYYPLYKEAWKSRDGGTWTFSETIDYPFQTPPINIFKSNRKSMPIFEAEKPLIDAYDEMISKSMNEIDRYNALITLFGNRVSAEFLEAFDNGEITAIDDLETDARTDLPRYLEKNLGGVTQFYNDLLDRVYKLYKESVNVVNLSDESFGTIASGVAMAFKLLGMEFKASQIDTYFNRGMLRRLELYADVYNAGVNQIDVNNYRAVITNKRNIPIDIKANAEVAQILSQFISDETLLEYLPNQIVPDVRKEMERKAAEMPEDILGLDDDDDKDS